MKTKNIVLIVLLAAAVAAGWWYANKSRPAAVDHSQHQDVYYCPMHPEYKSDRPGNCPICQMKLVKKEEHSQAPAAPMTMGTHSSVSLDLQRQQLIGIKTTPVVKKNLVKIIHANGYVAHDLELYDAQLEYIRAWQEFYPFLTRRPIKEQFRTDWREYYRKPPAQNRWRSDEKVKAQQKLLKAEYELIHMGLTESELQQLREVKPGEPWIQPELLFFEEGQPVWIYAEIFESDLGFLAVGQKAAVSIPAYFETTPGMVTSVTPVVDPESRTTRVRVELPDYRGELSVGMFVNVDFPVELNTELLVPREAVMDTGLTKTVFVVTGEGTFEPRHIETGFEGNGMVVVKFGLKEGEQVVSSGNFLLDSESRLRGQLAGGSTTVAGGHKHD